MLERSKSKPRPLSPAEKEMLCLFVASADLQAIGADQRWHEVLGEAPAEVVKRLMEERLLQPADPGTKLNSAFTVPGLKFMLRRLGLPTDGDKDALVARLVTNDPAGIAESTRELDLYQCTAAGREVAERHHQARAAERREAEREVVACLQRRDYAGALQRVGGYEAQQVFPRGSGVRWAEFGADADLRDRLRYLFHRTPRLIDHMAPETLEPLRIAAAMQWIWGSEDASQWLPAGLDVQSHLDAEGICRALMFHADYLVSLEHYRARGFRHVTITHVNDHRSCPACAAISGRPFPIDDAPELPYPGCTCPLGCRCSMRSA